MDSAVPKAFVLKGGVVGEPCPTRPRDSRLQRRSCVPRNTNRLTVKPMSRPSASAESIREAVENAIPNVGIESIRVLPSSRLQRTFSIQTADGRTLHLTLSPPPPTRLLRAEQCLTVTEALVVQWVTNLVVKGTEDYSTAGGADEKTQQVYGSDGLSVKKEQGTRPLGTGSVDRDVLGYLPAVVAYSPMSRTLGSFFNLFEQPPGIAISSLTESLTATERRSVDLQTGKLIRRLSGFVSPNGQFGSAAAVIGAMPVLSTFRGDRGTGHTTINHGGVTSWTQAFHSLLEGILRDAEDMTVAISYEAIRGHFHRLGHLLDAVTTARLVVVDAGADDNILVSRTPKAAKALKIERRRVAPPDIKDQVESVSSTPTSPPESGIIVTGLFNWSNVIFGDPLFTTIFIEDPTPEFSYGFSGRHIADPPPIRQPTGRRTGQPGNTEAPIKQEPGFDLAPGPGSGDDEPEIIQDPRNAPIRLLLYECYHATTSVVKQFYRPHAHSGDDEIVARRRLAAVLAKLEMVDEKSLVVGGERGRTGRGEMA
ncbi:hypothetical protein F4778DRAFT_773119 [Xylariomycetidae sp. FL2044]|nr:hypothetical protein F4778DRAFT_773119 [Xylariomycetidae sp. FL2044]